MRDIVDNDVQIGAPSHDVRHEVAMRATDVEYAPAGRRQIIDNVSELLENGLPRHVKVLFVFVRYLEMCAHCVRINVSIRPNESAITAIQQVNQRAVVDVLAESPASRSTRAVRASRDLDCLYALEPVTASILCPV